MDNRWQRWGARALTVVMAVSLGAAVSEGTAAAAKPTWATLPKDRPVPGAKAKLTPLPRDAAAASAVRALSAPRWPAAGVASVTMPSAAGTGRAAAAPVRAAALPVWLAPSASQRAAGAGGPRQVRVEMLDHAVTDRAGVRGVAVKLSAEQGSGRVALSVDYGPFAGAFGGDWANRLRIVPLPECALSTPDRPGCQAGDPLPTRNDVKAKRVTADVDTGQRLFAVAAGASGSSGNFGASSLSQSATWQVSPQTGDFSWSYQLDTPPGLNGPVPDLDLAYSSQSVDGRTASTNNQPSWVGEGFNLWSGYIERSYLPCSEDGSAGSPKRGDLCFAYDNATMSLGGSATELVRDDATGGWRPKNDDGSRIERLTGAVNGDTDGEHWKVTKADGTQYFFGRNRLPHWTSADPVTNSAWTVPVFGNNPGEPCYNATFANASCQQAWRWNLDYVVDPRGNALAYFYGKETNYYARNRSTATPYDRGGYLTEARYGLRDSAPYATAPTRVSFGVVERCLPSGTITCSEAQFTTANAAYWPDTPVDQNCKSGTSCGGQISPTFWTRKRLTTVTTQVWGGSGYRDVDSWTLRQQFPDSDSSTPSLWLAGITHTGKLSGSASLPEVTFSPIQLPNRVDGQDGIAPMVKNRVRSVTSEAGGVLSVTYSEPECAVGALPTPDANTKRCYPTYWTPDGATAPVQDWFHKYVVGQTVEDDRIDGSPDQVTSYEYVGAPGWHFADDDGLVKEKEKTWSQWRGYERVRVRKGAAPEQQSETEYLYLRGMNGDRLNAGGTRTASVVDSDGRGIVDEPHLQGFVREEIERDGPGGAEVSGKINDPLAQGPTATRVRSWGTTRAYRINISKVRTRVPLAAGGLRRTEATTTYTAEGLPSLVDDAGDLAVTGDEKCTRDSYVRNDTAWMVAFPSEVETVSVPCSVDPLRPAQVISDERMSYDGQAFGAAPTQGLPTRTEELSGPGTYVTTARSVYDAHGRVTERYDSLGNKSGTAYTPATGGPLTRTVTTDPLGYTTTTDLEPAWGEELAITTDSGKRTDFAYDALGRLTQVWLPGRVKGSQSASEEYAYQVGTNILTAVTTRQLRNDGSGYNVSHEIFDGLLRPRQAQHPAPGGGRVLTDVSYDSRGLVSRRNDAYPDDQPPGTDLFVVPDAQVPGQTVYSYDGAERETSRVFRVRGVEKWRTTTAHLGDRVTVDPPSGETPTMTIVDAGGQITELRQYLGDTAAGAYDTTRYTYTPDDELDTVTDPAGNVRRYHYDLRGRLTSVDDPDAGTTVMSYDDEDRLTARTDSRNRTITYTYDALDRVTASYEGTTKLTGFVYDTITPGQLTSSTRYVNGQPYTTTVTGYDEADRPKGTRISIPSVKGEEMLAGVYDFSAAYNLDGTLAQTTYPSAGGLPKETVRHSYDDLGMPTTTTGATSYVTETLHSKLAEPIRHVFSTGAKSVVRTYSYEEGTRRLQNVVTERDGTPQRIGDTTYSYDPAGNITGIADAPPGRSADNQCFRYDYLRRLTEAWTPGSGDCAAAPTVAGLAGPAPYWQSFGYDKVGNRTREVQHAAGGDTTRTYTTPAAGAAQPHTLTSVATTGASASRTDTFGYDPAGNTTKRVVNGVTQALDWDVEGHLATVTEGAKTTGYVYDADGERLIRRDPGGTTLYLDGMELKLANGQVSGLRYYQHGDDIVAMRSVAGVSFLLGDHHGTDEISVDAATMAVTQRRFDPFGAPRGVQPQNWPGERAFVGGTADPSSGLIHLGAREYDAAVGRFISLDPVVDVHDPQQMHGYAYANNSPETFSDADGLWWGSSLWKKAQAAWRAWTAWKAWKARYDAWRSWVAKQYHAAKKKAKHLVRKYVPRGIRKAISRANHAIARQVHKQLRTFRQTVKRAAAAVKRSVSNEWKVYKRAGTWIKDHRAQIYTVTKLVVGAVALFTCTICAIAAYASLAFTAYDTGVAVHDALHTKGKERSDNIANVGLGVLGIATFGWSGRLKETQQTASAAYNAIKVNPRGADVYHLAQRQWFTSTVRYVAVKSYGVVRYGSSFANAARQDQL
jgi:RHS repeat-associated protein